MRWGSFFMRKYRHKEGGYMFSDEIRERIFMDIRMQKIPFDYQSTAIRVIEEILDEMGLDLNAIPES